MNEGTLRARTPRALREAGIRPSRRLGQNYVVDEDLISCILDAACLSKSSTVLEIGSGTGNLTLPLAEAAGRVIAVEVDGAAAKYLMGLAAEQGNVEVVNGDILAMELPKADRVVSNLPYSISTPITFKLLLEGDFGLAALTYQTEVAERLLAQPGSHGYSRLSVMSSLFASIERVRDFPPESFYPRPRVGSTIIKMRKKGRRGPDLSSLDGTLKALFSQRRRSLRKALVAYEKLRGLGRGKALAAIEPPLLEKRVFEITPEEFLALDRCLREAAGAGR